MTRCACGYLTRRLPCAVCAAGVAMRRVEAPVPEPLLALLRTPTARPAPVLRGTAGRKPSLSDAGLRTALRAWAARHDGYAPTVREMAQSPDLPHPNTVSKLCGVGLGTLTRQLGLKLRPSGIRPRTAEEAS